METVFHRSRFSGAGHRLRDKGVKTLAAVDRIFRGNYGIGRRYAGSFFARKHGGVSSPLQNGL